MGEHVQPFSKAVSVLWHDKEEARPYHPASTTSFSLGQKLGTFYIVPGTRLELFHVKRVVPSDQHVWRAVRDLKWES